MSYSTHEDVYFSLDNEYGQVFRDGDQPYTVYWNVEVRGYQDGWYEPGTMYNRWGDPGDPPDGEITDVGVDEIDYRYVVAFKGEGKEVEDRYNNDEEPDVVFYDDYEGISDVDWDDETARLWKSLKQTDKKGKSYDIEDVIDEAAEEKCWDC